MGSMNSLNYKVGQMLPAASYANDAALDAAAVEIDCRGFRWLMCSVNVGATDHILAVKAQASATSGSGYADITGAAFTNISATDDDSTQTILVDCMKVARYVILDFTATTGSAVLASADGFLFEPWDTANADTHDSVT